MPGKSKQLKRAAHVKRMQLTERDIETLSALACHRFLSGDQLRRLVLHCGPSRARRRLRALFDHGLVNRIALSVQRAPSLPPFVYELSSAGQAVVREVEGSISGRPLAPIGRSLMRHKFWVNEFFITASESVRDTGYSIVDWRHEQQLKLPSADGLGRTVKVPLANSEGRVEQVSFLPDGFFELACPDQRRLAFFVEIDCSTHALSVWKKRAQLYLAYGDPSRGLFRQHYERQAFRLLIAASNDYRGRSRCDNILRTIEQTVGPTNMFLGTTMANVTSPDLLFGEIWRQVGSREQIALLPKPSRPNVRVANRQRVVVKNMP